MDVLWLTVSAVVIQMVSAYCAYQYLVHRVDKQTGIRVFFKPKFSYIHLFLCICALAIAVMIFAKGFFYGNATYIRALINAEVFIWLTVLGYVDLKENIIPNHMIGLGLLFWLGVVLLDVFVARTPWKDVAVFSMSGGLIIGGILFIIALVVKSALGMGDVKMFTVLGLLYGLNDTYSILLFTIVVMAVVSIILLVAKKVTAKTAVPMAPFVVIGFVLSILAGM